MERKNKIVRLLLGVAVSAGLVSCRSGIKGGDVGVTTDKINVTRRDGRTCTIGAGNEITFGKPDWFYPDYKSEGIKAIEVMRGNQGIMKVLGCFFN